MTPLRIIVELARRFPGLYLLNFLLWSAVHGLPLALGAIVKQVFDRIAGDQAASGVYLLIGMLVAVQLTRVVTLVAGLGADFTMMFLMGALLRTNALDQILRRPGAQSLPTSTGDALTRFRDDADEVAGMMSWSGDIIYRSVFALIAIVTLLRINVLATFIAFIPLFLLAMLAMNLRRKVVHYREEHRDAAGKAGSFVMEVLTALLSIKAARAERQILAHFAGLSEKRRFLATRDQLFSNLLTEIFGYILELGTGLTLLVVGYHLTTGRFSVGDLALFIIYLGWLSEVTYFFGRAFARFKQAGVSFSRLADLLEPGAPDRLLAYRPFHEPIALPAPLPRVPFEGLEVRGLSYRFPGSERGIDGVTFRLAPGTVTVITGKVGSGKTTLLRVLLGLLPDDGGERRWNGQPVESPTRFFLPPRVAYKAQVPGFLSLSVRQNVLAGLPEDASRLEDALGRAVLSADVAQMEAGLDTEVGSHGRRLSGGQAHRLALARMFAREADLYVVDELSGALDGGTAQTLLREFRRPGSAYLLVSHHPSALRLADTLLVMDEGRIVEQGTLEELLARSPAVQELWSAARAA